MARVEGERPVQQQPPGQQPGQAPAPGRQDRQQQAPGFGPGQPAPGRRRQAPTARRPQGRRIRVQIRKVSPWSVLKFSLLFYFCMMIVFVIGLAILYMMVDALGVVDSLEELLESLGFGGEAGFEVDGGFLFRTVFLIGLISVVVWSALTLFFSFLYNLISDLVGGIEVTLAEKR